MKRIGTKISILYFLILVPVCHLQTSVLASNGTVKVQETHQTMAGFGASVAYYNNWLTNHPNKNDLYSLIFEDLSLDILRLRNTYRNNPGNFAPEDAEIVSNMYTYTSAEPKILISSWSPPASLKNNNNVNGGTLKRVEGAYVYGDFGRYWVDALEAYSDLGIVPDYISIQNEPSYEATWESCVFDPAENVTWAGYNRALDSVYVALQQLAIQPMILASEVHGIGYNTFQNYANQFNHDYVDGYAYHLYHGDGENNNTNPDLFNSNLTAIATNYDSKPIFQTEYDRGDWFNTVWLMHNCLVYGNVSGYLYWGLIWDAAGGNPLIGLENPWSPGGWSTPNGYILRPVYWAFRQYSKFIDSGWKRVTATSDDTNLRISAFINPEGNMLTLVVLNVGAQVGQMDFSIQGFTVTNGIVVRTSATEEGEEISNSYDGSSTLELTARSITTVSFSGNLADAIESQPVIPVTFSLTQNYPNPFNPTTTIDYSLAIESFVQLKIFSLSGQEIRTLVQEKMPVGRHTVHFNAGDLGSGLYVYQLKAGDFIQSRKMIVIK